MITILLLVLALTAVEPVASRVATGQGEFGALGNTPGDKNLGVQHPGRPSLPPMAPAGLSSRQPQPDDPVRENTVVLAEPDDPYYLLAEEIAQSEGLTIVGSPDEALVQHPVFLLWIVSPSRLSDQVMADFGSAVRDQPSAISLGIISGSTLEQARDLWLRASKARGQRAFAVNGEYPAARVFEGRIIAFDGDQTQTRPLTKTGLEQILANADYLTFTGHGGSGYWRLTEDTKLIAEDIPRLPPIVVGTGSCQTFRIWQEGSIALRFTEQGAAAYAGFVYSPNEGFLIGEFDGLPFRYTWPDFPIGHAIQVQSHGTLQGFAKFPYYYLLGDPRIALQSGPPYRVLDDRQDGELRTLTATGAPPGTIPVRIPGGGGYSFVEIPGVSAAWERDPFYNSRLQMANIGDDKTILFAHEGGDFTVRLRSDPPYHWRIVDPLIDALDFSLIFNPQTGGDILSLVFAGIVLVGVAWFLRRRKGWRRMLPPAALIGTGFALLQGMYALARLDDLTITSKPVVFSPLSPIGVFLLAGCGALLFLNVQSRWGQGIAVLVATFPAWAAMAFSLGLVTLFNQLAVRPKVGYDLYNYTLGLMSLIAFVLECMLVWPVFGLLRRWVSRPVETGKILERSL